MMRLWKAAAAMLFLFRSATSVLPRWCYLSAGQQGRRIYGVWIWYLCVCGGGNITRLGCVVNHLPNRIHWGICRSSPLKEKGSILTETGRAAPPLGPGGLMAELHQGAHADLSCGWMAGPIRVGKSCCGRCNVSRRVLLNLWGPLWDL